jgi:hypothetical protein
MYEFYQVKAVSLVFYPYHFQYTAGQVTGVSTQGHTVQSIIDPENSLPNLSIQSAFYSYGNNKTTLPYREHSRGMRGYTDLGLSKQDTLILRTNASSLARE